MNILHPISMPSAKANIALLIDADNAPIAKIAVILAELAKYGVANVRRAYGNWASPSLHAWPSYLHKYAIRPIQQFDYTKGKNAADAALIIDAMDLLYTQQLDAFALVSSDCDFTPLVMRLLTNGLKVYGFGEQKTPAPFVAACSHFFFLDAPDHAAIEHPKASLVPKPLGGELNIEILKAEVVLKQTGTQLKQDTKLMNVLRNAVSHTKETDGWSSLSAVGNHINQHATFDLRNYGYAKLSLIFQAIDVFETQQRNTTSYVRIKPKGNQSKS